VVQASLPQIRGGSHRTGNSDTHKLCHGKPRNYFVGTLRVPLATTYEVFFCDVRLYSLRQDAEFHFKSTATCD
jgi:hypothetical protein